MWCERRLFQFSVYKNLRVYGALQVIISWIGLPLPVHDWLQCVWYFHATSHWVQGKWCIFHLSISRATPITLLILSSFHHESRKRHRESCGIGLYDRNDDQTLQPAGPPETIPVASDEMDPVDPRRDRLLLGAVCRRVLDNGPAVTGPSSGLPPARPPRYQPLRKPAVPRERTN